MGGHHASGAIARARGLRQKATPAERTLWAELRKLKLNIRRQAPIGRYVVDFVSHQAAIVVELDGPWHDLPEKQLHDLERTAWLTSQGYRVLRFKNRDVLDDLMNIAAQIAVAIRPPKALPLDGGGLGGGARAEAGVGSRVASISIAADPQTRVGGL